mgnify:CR=1 FL=1
MTEVELAYVAGLFDGEGCVNIWKHNDRGVMRHRLRATLANTHKPFGEWLKREFGGSVTVYKSQQHKTLYTWSVYGKACARFLGQIIPYLRLKQDQAVVAIEFQKRMIIPHGQMTQDEFDARERLQNKMKELKNVQ